MWRRRHLGATQACRQLRVELLPLCKAKIEYHVWLRDVEKFMEILLPDGSNDTSKATGSLVIGLNRHDYGNTGQVADLLPLIKLYRAANATSCALTVRFMEYSMRGNVSEWAHELDQFFSPRDEAKWQRFTEEYATAVVLDMDLPGVEIVVKEDYVDATIRPMDKYGRLDEPLSHRSVGELAQMRGLRKAWESSVGLCFSDYTQNRMRIRKD